MKRTCAIGSLIGLMACSSPTSPSAPLLQTYSVSLAPRCLPCFTTSIRDDAQVFPISLSRSGMITATLTGVTPTPTAGPSRVVIGTPISPPQPGYGVHDCDLDDARYEMDYMSVRPAGLILPGQYANRLPASITRSGSSGAYCVAVLNADVVPSSATLSIITID